MDKIRAELIKSGLLKPLPKRLFEKKVRKDPIPAFRKEHHVK